MDSYGTSQETRGRSRSRSSSGRGRAVRRRASSSLSSSRSRSSVRNRGSRVALGNRTMVVSRNLRSNSFLPNRMECVMCTVWDGYWAVGSMTAARGNYANIKPNSLTPFTGDTYTLTAAAGAAGYGFNAAEVQGSAIANKPIGWTQYSTLYQNYRVKKYRLEVTVVPQSTGDTARLVVFPLGGEAIPSATNTNVTTRVLEAQPGAKAITVCCATDASNGNNTIVFYGDCAKDLGKTALDYMGLADTSVASVPAAGVVDLVGIFVQQLNGANNASVCPIQMRLTQNIVFYDLTAEIN